MNTCSPSWAWNCGGQGVDTQASLGGNAACRSAAGKGPLLGTFPQAGRAPGKPGFLQTPSERSLPWCILHLYNKS